MNRFKRFMSGLSHSRKPLFSMNVLNVCQENYETCINSAANTLLNCGIIALPTDTIYGIAGLAQENKPIGEIYEIKKRHEQKPIAICVSYIEDLYKWGKITVPRELLTSLFPGPVTILFERLANLNQNLNKDHNLVGIRIPDNSFIRDVVAKCGSPLALTSANISAEISPLEIIEFKELWGRLDKIFDAGRLGVTEESRKGSTIIDLSVKGKYKIIREGCASKKTIEILNKFGLSEVKYI